MGEYKDKVIHKLNRHLNNSKGQKEYKLDTNTEMCIFSTTDYGKFKKLTGNRVTSENNIKAIKLSMAEEQLIVPIICNENMEIIDGQHRKDAAQALGLPVYYFIVNGYGLKQVQRMNSHMKNWNDSDYLDSFINRYSASDGTLFKDYQIFKELIDNAGISTIKTGLTLVYDGMTGKKVIHDFRRGNLVIEDLDKAKKYISMLKDIEPTFGVRCKQASFVSVFIALTKTTNFSHETFVRNSFNKAFAESIQATSGTVGFRALLCELASFGQNRKLRVSADELRNIMEDTNDGEVINDGDDE